MGGGREPEPRWVRWLPVGLFAVATLILFRDFVVGDEMLLGLDTLALGYVARDFFAAALESGTFPLWNPRILGGTPFLESLAGGDSLYPPSLLLLLGLDTHRALGWKLVLHVFLAGAFSYLWLRRLRVSRGVAMVGGLAYLLAPFMVTLVYPGHDGKIFVTALTPLLFWAAEGTLERRSLLPFAGVSLVVALVILTTHFQMAYFLFGAVGIYVVARLAWAWWEGRGEAGGGSSGGADPGAAAGSGGADPGAGPDSGGRDPGARSGGAGGAGDDRRSRWDSPGIRFAGFLLASVLGAGVAAVQLLPAVDYVTDSSRRTATTVRAEGAGAVEYSSSWSLHPEEVAALVVPEFVGASLREGGWSDGTYWGRNPAKLNSEYGGVVVLVLALVGVAVAGRRRIGWVLGGIGGLALLYGLGAHTPVWRIFYEIVPGVSLFRAPSISIFLFGFAAMTLAALGLDALVSDPAEAGARAGGRADGAGRADRRGGGKAVGRAGDGSAVGETRWRTALRWLWGSAGVLFGLTLLQASGVLLPLWRGVVYRDLPASATPALAAAEPFITRGFFLAALFVGATAGLLHAHRRGVLGRAAVLVGIGLLVAADLARVDAPFVQTIDFHRWAAPDANVRFLLERREAEPPFRVLSLAQSGQDVRPAMFGLDLAAGHHPNDLARYRELIGMRGSGMPQNLLHRNVYGILNVRYLIWPDLQQGPLEGLPRVSEAALPDGRVLEAVYRLPDLPRARLVGEAVVVPEDEAVATILSDRYDPMRQAVLQEPPPIDLPGGSVEGEVEWLERGPNRLALRVRTDRPALLVVAENWYPAWRATVDGVETDVLRADHTLRAVALPGGDHRVELSYRSPLLRGSLAVSLVSLLVVLATGVWAVARSRRAGREPAIGARDGRSAG